MTISRERLLAEAEVTGFGADVFEKVAYLIALLNGISRHPFLRGKLVLKGGTALNLFLFDVPRLSVDIDLNYVGGVSRDDMLAERPQVVDALTAICKREGLAVRTQLDGHAGMTWFLRYPSALGGRGSLKVDLNFMFRVPLWPALSMDSHPVGSHRADNVPVLDPHELAAGKLAALLSRQTSRDLFDAYELLVRGAPGLLLDPERLRLAFVVYGAINREDWRMVDASRVSAAAQDLQSYLLPLLRADTAAGLGPVAAWGTTLAEACREAMGIVLPLRAKERDFLDLLLTEGIVEPGLLTLDRNLAGRILQHPGLAWKALNVRNHRAEQGSSPERADAIEGP